MKSGANKSKNEFEMMKLDGKPNNKPALFAGTLLRKLKNFEPWIRTVRALRTEGLKTKHVKEINDVINNENNDDSLNLIQEDMSMNITSFGATKITQMNNDIEEIVDTASKEYSNEILLHNMKSEWQPIRFEIKEHKDTYILEGEGVENIIAVLDDHLIKTQTMKGSPYAVFMIEEITEWENLLERTQDFLEVWVKVQGTWRYLEPVFSSEDLMNQMRQHGTIFREVDREWKKLMSKVVGGNLSHEIWAIDGLGDILKECDRKLEEVTKGLNQYLESK
jgi:dynein heavy chain